MIWTNDWEYGAAAIMGCVFFHTVALFGLTQIIFHERVRRFRQSSFLISMLFFTVFVLAAIMIHALDPIFWAGVYLYIGAAPDYQSAYLHSLGAFTTLGDDTVIFDKKWRLLLQLEALNGAVALGLTTALLYSSARRIQQVIDAATVTEKAEDVGKAA